MQMREKDMYLPKWVCNLGIVFLSVGSVCFVCMFTVSLYFIIGAAPLLCLGIAAVLCWKNQWAVVLNEYVFIYSTMFGNQHEYRFSEIKGLKQNTDSFTLYLKNGKVHIEACAIISDRFIDKVNHMLKMT